MIATVAIHRHPSLITLRSARDDPSGGRCPTQIPQLDTPQASKISHNSIHNLVDDWRATDVESRSLHPQRTYAVSSTRSRPPCS